MQLKKKIFTLTIFLVLISIFGTVYAFNYSDYNNVSFNNANETSLSGCCSIILQLKENNSIMSFRRDSDFDADIYIKKINWHGIPAVKQYKTDGKYYCHVIITNNGWMIGLGGIDDGADNQECENIAAKMISKNNEISKKDLIKIQKIKKSYGRGHILIKAPNGNYGIATPDKIVTKKLNPGQYVSIPNDYSYSRKGNISLNTTDKIKSMNQLARSDKYGEFRRDITTFNYYTTNKSNITDIYVSNEDGALIKKNYTGFVDDIYINNSLIKAEDIPIAPNYKYIGTIKFSDEKKINLINNPIIVEIIVILVITSIMSFIIIYKLVKLVLNRNND